MAGEVFGWRPWQPVGNHVADVEKGGALAVVQELVDRTRPASFVSKQHLRR